MISDPQDLRWDLLGAEARGEAAESGRGRWGGLRASATGACVRKGAGTHTHGVTPRGRGEAAEDRGPRPATPPLGLRRGRPCCRPPWPPAEAIIQSSTPQCVVPRYGTTWARPAPGREPATVALHHAAGEAADTHAAAAPACPAEGSRPGPGGGLCISMASARVHQVAGVSRVRRGPSV